MLDDAFQARLTSLFADAVMKRAALPAARRADVEGAPTWSTADGQIVCTCGITGSSTRRLGTEATVQLKRLRSRPANRQGALSRVRRRTITTPGSTPPAEHVLG